MPFSLVYEKSAKTAFKCEIELYDFLRVACHENYLNCEMVS